MWVCVWPQSEWFILGLHSRGHTLEGTVSMYSSRTNREYYNDKCTSHSRQYYYCTQSLQ